jgi:hypothetical protein
LAPGNSVGALTINNNLTLGGDVRIELDKSLAPSNDIVAVTGTLSYGGTLTVTNLGATPLAVGDTFQIFPAGGSGSVVVLGDAGVGNAFDFSESTGVLTVVPGTGPTLQALISGTSITFTWDDAGGPFKLVAQTNLLSAGLNRTNWFDYPDGTNGVVVPINKNNPTVFYGLEPQ